MYPFLKISFQFVFLDVLSSLLLNLLTIIQNNFKNWIGLQFYPSPFSLVYTTRVLSSASDKLLALFYINSKLFFAEWSSKFREKNKQEQKQSRRKSFSVNINTDIWWVVSTLFYKG